MRFGTLLRVYDALVMVFGLTLLGLLCLGWTLMATILYPVLPPRLRTAFGRRAIMLGFRTYLASLSLTRRIHFDLSELDALRNDAPLIIAPNHPCLLDAVMVISRLPNIACVMKKQLMSNLFLGAGARLAGYIRNESIQQMVHQACDDFKSGSHLLLFPEGTRTTCQPVSPFTGSVGLISRQARVPIQTIFIETESPYLGKGWSLFRQPILPIRYKIRLGRRFDPPDNLRRFTAELEQYFLQQLSNSAQLSSFTEDESATDERRLSIRR